MLVEETVSKQTLQIALKRVKNLYSWEADKLAIILQCDQRVELGTIIQLVAGKMEELNQ